jgi:hypothetical protein
MFPHVPGLLRTSRDFSISFPQLLFIPHSISAISSFRFMFRATSLLFYFGFVANNYFIVFFILVANN